MHNLSSVYFVIQPPHVSGIFVAPHRELYCVYTTIGTCYIYIYIYIYIYSIPPDDGLQICSKHVEVDWWNKLKINSASSWFLLHGYTKMHGQQTIKFILLSPVSLLVLGPNLGSVQSELISTIQFHLFIFLNIYCYSYYLKNNTTSYKLWTTCGVSMDCGLWDYWHLRRTCYLSAISLE